MKFKRITNFLLCGLLTVSTMITDPSTMMLVNASEEDGTNVVHESDNEAVITPELSVALTAKLMPTPAIAPAVTNLKVTNNGFDSFKITWDKAPCASGYELYCVRGYAEEVKTIDTTKTSFIHKKLKSNKKYYYSIRAYVINVYGQKVYSMFHGGIGRKPALSKPSLTVATKNNNSIDLTWKQVGGAQKYEIYRATSKKGMYTKIATTKSTKYTSKKLSKNKTYYYKIKAVQVISKKTYTSPFSTVELAKTKK